MTLKEIEKIVRANFIFDSSDESKDVESGVPFEWRVVKKKHCYNDMMALIVFCGVSWMMGFDDPTVFKYLEIKRERHLTILLRYKKTLTAHQAAQTQSLFSDIMPDVDKMIMQKSQIVLNSIHAHQPKPYINLADFNF